jgi:hypothetical protein
MKRQRTNWEKIFANCTCDERLTSQICKKFKQLNSKKTDNLIFKMSKGSKYIFVKKDIQMISHLSLGIWKMLNILNHS